MLKHLPYKIYDKIIRDLNKHFANKKQWFKIKKVALPFWASNTK